jgi:hypothetical protein
MTRTDETRLQLAQNFFSVSFFCCVSCFNARKIELLISEKKCEMCELLYVAID